MPRWTEQARQKQAEMIRQNKPWEKSTGPTSDEGKAQSARNATKTGLRGADYLALRRALITQSNYLRKIEGVIS